METTLTLTTAFLLGWFLGPRLRCFAVDLLVGCLLTLWVPVWLASTVLGWLVFAGLPAGWQAGRLAAVLAAGWPLGSMFWVWASLTRASAWLKGSPAAAPPAVTAAHTREPVSWDDDGAGPAPAPGPSHPPGGDAVPSPAVGPVPPSGRKPMPFATAMLFGELSRRWERALVQAAFEGRVVPGPLSLERVHELVGGMGVEVAVAACVGQCGDWETGVERFLERASALVLMGHLERQWRSPADDAGEGPLPGSGPPPTPPA